jgi:hypothetical protein
MRYRYAGLDGTGRTPSTLLILLIIISVVPVVRLELTRLFTVPGF